MTETKSSSNTKVSLMHFLVNHLTAKDPEVLNWADKMAHIEPASRSKSATNQNNDKQKNLLG